MRYNILLISLFILTSATSAEDEANATAGIMCYRCTTANSMECVSLESYKSRSKFLVTCQTGCAVQLGEYGLMGDYDRSVILSRDCDDLTGCKNSKINCCKCNSDGCNINNYCSSANTLHPKIIVAVVFCISRQSLGYLHQL